MKKILLVLCFMFICGTANAEVYLLVNSATSEIKDLSPENDAVVEAGYQKIILPGKVSDYELQYHPSYYKYKDKKFVVNIKKISDEELAKQENKEKADEEVLIQNEIRRQAIEKLKAGGISLKFYK